METRLPITIGNAIQVDEIYLNGAVIRAVGDATTQDGGPTTEYHYGLHWTEDDRPDTLKFRSAPTGEYAYVEMRIARRPNDPRHEAFEVRGAARRNGEWRDFLIRAEAPIVVANIPASRRLEVSKPVTIELELDASLLVEHVDFDELPLVNGKLRLDESTPGQLAAFTGALANAFHAR